jgi:PAS domain S-box-containing protein
MKKLNFLSDNISFFPVSLVDLFGAIIFLFGLYLTSLVSYDIFHSLVELFSIIVAFGMFIISWNARSFFDNHFLLFLSIAYIFVSVIDIAHTLAYKGVGIFYFFDPTSNLATQLWVAARYLQAISLLAAPLFLTRKINIRFVAEIFFLIIVSVFVSIFYLKVFPTAYIDGLGLTPFKIWSEYIISFILVCSIVFLFRKRKTLDKKVFSLILYSIIFTIASELSFTTYIGVFDFSNMLGHLFKLISFLLLYKVILEVGLKNPLAYIFRNMEQNAEILRNSELKFRTLIKLAINPIVMTDGRGVIILSNDSTERVFGWKEEEIVNKSFAEIFLLQNKDKVDLNKFINTEEESRVAHERHQILSARKNKEEFNLELNSSHWTINNETFFGFLMRDLTKEIELDKSKSEFISLAAHQLRTPLATISLTSEMLLKGIVGDISKENKKYFKIIIKEIKGMNEMIRIFLNITRIEMGKFPIKMESVELSEVLDNITANLLQQINYKEIRFKKNYKKNLPVLNLDKNVMKIILENLLSNAIKYSNKGGTITLTAKEYEENVIIEVKDDGVGIPEKDQPRIFTKMFRAENVFRIKNEGSGFGLYLVKNLAKQINYDITFKSKENQGSTFTLSIPKEQN